MFPIAVKQLSSRRRRRFWEKDFLPFTHCVLACP